VKGTPLYMAYEQAIGGQITPQTDIWPLGLIAFFSMTGHHYWKTANAAEGSLTQLFAEVLSLPIDLASVRAREIGAGVELTKAFDAWFARCVEHDSAQRFSTAGECAVLLARALGVESDHQAGTPDANDADVLAPTRRSIEDPKPARASNLAATPPGVSARAAARSTSGKLHPARLVLGVAAALGLFSAGLFAHRRPPTPAREQPSASGAPSPQVPPTTAPAKDSPHGSASSIAGGSSQSKHRAAQRSRPSAASQKPALTTSQSVALPNTSALWNCQCGWRSPLRTDPSATFSRAEHLDDQSGDRIEGD
jgi:serine/threonine protein kinase